MSAACASGVLFSLVLTASANAATPAPTAPASATPAASSARPGVVTPSTLTPRPTVLPSTTGSATPRVDVAAYSQRLYAAIDAVVKANGGKAVNTVLTIGGTMAQAVFTNKDGSGEMHTVVAPFAATSSGTPSAPSPTGSNRPARASATRTPGTAGAITTDLVCGPGTPGKNACKTRQGVGKWGPGASAVAPEAANAAPEWHTSFGRAAVTVWLITNLALTAPNGTFTISTDGDAQVFTTRAQSGNGNGSGTTASVRASKTQLTFTVLPENGQAQVWVVTPAATKRITLPR